MTRWQQRQKRRWEKGLCAGCSKPGREGFLYCESCADRRRKQQNNWQHNNHDKISAIHRRHRAKKLAKGICQACTKPAGEGHVRCERHRKIDADRKYKKSGKFGIRRPQRDKLIANYTIKRVKDELGRGWNEAEEFVRNHLELFIEKDDQALWRAIPIEEEWGGESLCEY